MNFRGKERGKISFTGMMTGFMGNITISLLNSNLPFFVAVTVVKNLHLDFTCGLMR